MANKVIIQSKAQKHDQRNIDMLISRLRKRLEDDPVVPRYIHTIRGIGYAFSNEFSKDSA